MVTVLPSRITLSLNFLLYVSTWSPIKFKSACVGSHVFYRTPKRILNCRKEYNMVNKVVKTQVQIYAISITIVVL